jgi:hypothetical protein
MGRSLLVWSRTDQQPSPTHYDYTGRDLDRPQLHARVYLSSPSTAHRRWSWYVTEIATIAAGEEATLAEALAAVERAYASWRNSERPH